MTNTYSNPVANQPTPTVPLSAHPSTGWEQRIERQLDQLASLSEQIDNHLGEEREAGQLPVSPGFRLSIVIPVFNERQTIEGILENVKALPVAKEIIVIDDCSNDGTRAILEAQEPSRDVRMVFKPKNEGKGAALRSGFATATGDVIVVQDADLEYDPRDIPSLITPILEGHADVVYGSRYLRPSSDDPSLVHRLGNRFLTGASNALTGLRLTDMETCYKAFRREVLTAIDLRQNRFGFEPEVTAKIARCGFRICEVPIRYNPRSFASGKKIRLKDAFNALYCIVRYGMKD